VSSAHYLLILFFFGGTEMHYGDGIKKEALRQAIKHAEAEGAFEYQSPLGKGFSFSREPINGHVFNPFSKHSTQGPTKLVFEYEEGDHLGQRWRSMKEKVVHDVHHAHQTRNQASKERAKTNSRNKKISTKPSPYANFVTDVNGESARSPSNLSECIIS
jgi:hypothetical protein